ncbi:MAG: hypothetical protein ACOY0T_38475 [Myxococcota bacterium]
MSRESNAFDVLEQEILKAKAEALGRAGEKLRKAVDTYERVKASLPLDADELQRAHCARAWEDVLRAREVLVVLREGIGLRRHDSIDTEFGIPLEQREQ